MRNTPQYVLLGALLQLSGDEEFVEYEVCLLEVEDDVQFADVAVVLIHLLDVAVDDLERDELVICRIDPGDEEERCIAAINYFGVWLVGSKFLVSENPQIKTQMTRHPAGERRELKPLYSRKLHIRVLRARTSAVMSLTILAFSFGDSVVNHFARRYNPSLSISCYFPLWRGGYVVVGGSKTYYFALARQQDEVSAAVPVCEPLATNGPEGKKIKFHDENPPDGHLTTGDRQEKRNGGLCER